MAARETGIEMLRDAAWYEEQYNPRLTVPETAALLAAWPVRSAETCRRRPATVADHPYGPHPRERIDLHRAPQARGLLVHVHGGYWRSFSKADNAFVVDGFLDEGISVALVNYPLCPEVTVAAIAACVRRAFARLWLEVLDEAERAAVAVSGHSAGGYLAADLLATDWTGLGLPADPIRFALPVSGLFDLAPLIPTSMNATIGLTADTAAAWSLTAILPRARAGLVLAVGEREPAEFHRQAIELAAAWSRLTPRVVVVPRANHFTVLDSLAVPGGLLNRLALTGLGL